MELGIVERKRLAVGVDGVEAGTVVDDVVKRQRAFGCAVTDFNASVAGQRRCGEVNVAVVVFAAVA